MIPVLVSAREGILDRDKYASARGADLDGFEPEVRTATAAA
ncbi:hypothetical protein H180DRAFT_04637 [Streptomyces sp. WMMB 322]|nr:hypothetical protein H180DRAFT_04637 [Streptomyces sp. WMMB 322]